MKCFAIIYIYQGREKIYFFSTSESRESYLNFLVSKNNWNIIGTADEVPSQFIDSWEEYILSQEINSWE